MYTITAITPGMGNKTGSFEDGTTFGEALEELGINTQGKTLTIRGTRVQEDDYIQDDSMIRITKNVESA